MVYLYGMIILYCLSLSLYPWTIPSIPTIHPPPMGIKVSPISPHFPSFFFSLPSSLKQIPSFSLFVKHHKQTPPLPLSSPSPSLYLFRTHTLSSSSPSPSILHFVQTTTFLPPSFSRLNISIPSSVTSSLDIVDIFYAIFLATTYICTFAICLLSTILEQRFIAQR